MCHMAEAVLAGGIRRSSLISLFSADDGEMMYAKAPEQFEYGGKNGHRAMANNSVLLLRDSCTESQFRRIMQIEGEKPGFFFSTDRDFGCNPCGEIGLYPVCDGYTGFAFCNLTEINAAKSSCQETFFRQCCAASFIGTCQAGYIDFKYLGQASRNIALRDRLLGVSITGIMDNPEVFDWMAKGKETVRSMNVETAARLKFAPAQRITCIKPSGTASLVLGGVGSGIHPHHARRYFRRVTANPMEPVAKRFRETNPHMVEVKPNGDLSLVFPMQTNGVTLKDISAVDFLGKVFLAYDRWIGRGKLTHNVSTTVVYKPEEWEELLELTWACRGSISGITFLPWMADKGIPFVPRETVGEEDESKWQFILEHYRKVDYEGVEGAADVSEVACGGSSCELVHVDVAGGEGKYVDEEGVKQWTPS
jgi:ribonucleoside-diphosphate reductase alpha chain